MNNTINQLNFELTNLASESKRRNADIKQASEKSLEVLKKFSSSNTTESKFLKNLSRNPDFITPFLLSCQTRNPKYISISISCFHKLITSQAVPITKLELVLDAFIESTDLAIEIQLKILQCLPFLFQNYSIFINDKNLFKLLSICSTLQSSKSNIVNNTASATLSQLINLVFEKISDEDKTAEIDRSYVVPVDNEQTIEVGLNAFDGQRIFQDLCNLIEHQKPQFLTTNYITENFGFEILESVIKTNREIFLVHKELGFLLRTRIVPILLRLFSSSKHFLVLVRASRLILLLVKEQFEILKIETQVILSLLNHVLTKDSSSQFWKKILSLEIYKALLQDFKLIEGFFMEFDYEQDTKIKIFSDFWENCHELLNEQRYLLNTGQILQAPVLLKSSNSGSSGKSLSGSTNASSSSSPGPPELPPGLFQAKSTTKIQFIDLLDKNDPPQIHETYILYLVLTSLNSFSEGVYEYAIVDEDKETSTISQDKSKFVTAIIEQNYKHLYQIYEIFMFSTLDNDFFNRLLRSYQKFCQASGIIQLVDARDKFLNLLIKATLNLSGKSGFQYKNSVYSIGESIVGTISSTINQALATTPNQQNVYYQRNINSRHALCFKVVINLAISLGTVLKESNWRSIFITLQWMDYFVHGATDESATASSSNPGDVSVSSISVSGNANSSSSPLTSADLNNIENSIKKLNENINFYSNVVYHEILKSVISLSNDLMFESSGIVNKQPIIDLGSEADSSISEFQFQPAVYNKIFYIGKLKEISKINPRKFLLNDDQSATNWNLILEHYFKLITNRSFNYDLRLEVTCDFNSIIKYTAVDGFDQQDYYSQTEVKILNALDQFISKLITLPRPDELLVLNCDLEIQSQVLDTLKTLLDKYGTNFQKWNLVFNIVNSSFHDLSIQIDKLKPVVNSSFEALKMILDEFLSSLPFNQLKIAIDCISNFISQEVDLNISLNSISYFWLISDYLRGNLVTKRSAKGIKTQVGTEEELCRSVVAEGDGEDYNLLYVYLLYSLSKSIQQDSRLQVRNGAIQTFFSIIDSSSNNGTVGWDSIYDIIFVKLLMLEDTVEYSESKYLVLNGFVKLYINFFGSNFDDAKIKYWDGLISYCEKLIQLSNIELKLKVFKSFQELTGPFKQGELPVPVLQKLYKFWTSTKIMYNLVQNNLYQESLTALMECFPHLFELIQPILTVQMFEEILTALNSCIKYPVLPDFVSNDELRSTNLQESVYANLENLVQYQFPLDEPRYRSLLLQELTSIVVLPFHTREKIVAKFSKASQTKNFKIPSFTSVAHRSIDLLNAHLQNCYADLTVFIEDGSILRLFKDLFEPVQLRTKGITIKKHLWIQAMEMVMQLNEKIVTVIGTVGVERRNAEYWGSVVRLIEILNSYDVEDEQTEAIDIENLTALYTSVESNFESIKNQELISRFIKIVFDNSFLYELNEIDKLILDSYGTVEQFKKLPFEKLNDNSTHLQHRSRLALKRFNLTRLIYFNNQTALPSALPLFQIRICIPARKFINYNELINRSPIPALQAAELLELLNGYLEFIQSTPSAAVDENMKFLFLPLIKYCHKVPQLDVVITNILETV